jgi:hypothetical protein
MITAVFIYLYLYYKSIKIHKTTNVSDAVVCIISNCTQPDVKLNSFDSKFSMPYLFMEFFI